MIEQSYGQLTPYFLYHLISNLFYLLPGCVLYTTYSFFHFITKMFLENRSKITFYSIDNFITGLLNYARASKNARLKACHTECQHRNLFNVIAPFLELSAKNYVIFYNSYPH
jgi:hypothetical protein